VEKKETINIIFILTPANGSGYWWQNIPRSPWSEATINLGAQKGSAMLTNLQRNE